MFNNLPGRQFSHFALEALNAFPFRNRKQHTYACSLVDVLSLRIDERAYLSDAFAMGIRGAW